MPRLAIAVCQILHHTYRHTRLRYLKNPGLLGTLYSERVTVRNQMNVPWKVTSLHLQ